MTSNVAATPASGAKPVVGLPFEVTQGGFSGTLSPQEQMNLGFTEARTVLEKLEPLVRGTQDSKLWNQFKSAVGTINACVSPVSDVAENEYQTLMETTSKCDKGFRSLLEHLDRFREEMATEGDPDALTNRFSQLTAECTKQKEQFEQIKTKLVDLVKANEQIVAQGKANAITKEESAFFNKLIAQVHPHTTQRIYRDIKGYQEHVEGATKKLEALKGIWDQVSLKHHEATANYDQLSRVMKVAPDVVAIHARMQQVQKDLKDAEDASKKSRRCFQKSRRCFQKSRRCFQKSRRSLKKSRKSLSKKR